MSKGINILFTSSGRRVSLIKKFKETFIKEQLEGKIVTADLKNNAPTAFISDSHYIVPGVTAEEYITEILSICLKENITLVIPLIDTELTLLAENKYLFDKNNIKLLVSGKKLNEIASNKINTYNFFSQYNIETPKIYDEEDLINREYNFPLLIKPYDGSSSKGVTIVNTEEELLFFKQYIPNAIIQEFISGKEYTIDAMVDFEGNIKTIVPRLRMETRAGEVSKGLTTKDWSIIEAAADIINVLPEPVGCITLQCIKQEKGTIKFIEINPRFGGGIPLSIEAGANFPLWVTQLCQEKTFVTKDFSWREDFTMLRYDEAIFLGSSM